MNLRTPSPRLLLWAAASLLSCAVPSQAAWELVDDMEGGDQWQGAGSVEPDPGDGGNQVFALPNTGGLVDAHRPIPAIAEGATATLFFRIRSTGFQGGSDWVWGASADGSPQPFGDYEGYGRMVDDGDALRVDVHNAGGFSVVGAASSDTWHNVWLVLDNDGDVTDIHLGEGFAEPGDPSVSSFQGAGFRNGTDEALVSFMVANNQNWSTGFLDDLYIDLTGENLGLPPIPGTGPQAADDAVTVGMGGTIGFDPLSNDTGRVDPESLEIVSPPASGSVRAASTGGFVYEHDGDAPGSDSFRYRVRDPEGSASSEATVHVTIRGEFRLENVTAGVPLEKPSFGAGALVLEDALPGLDFPEAIAVTSVPGTPESLLIASVNGTVWYVPDSTAADPEKREVLDISSRSNFTRGRCIYSIECFPDFAETGHVIVNYQGDATRLPEPGPGESIHDVIPHLDKHGSPDPAITCDLRISRFTLSGDHLADAADGLSPQENDSVLATEFPYLNLAEQHEFHSINDAKFGPDGYLYVSFGDEGDQGSPYRNTQKITKDQFSSLIRIDVDPDSTHPKPNPHYAIPVGPLNGPESPNTPFTDPAAQEPNFRVPADNPFVVPAKGGDWDGFFNGVDHGPAGLDALDAVRDEIWAVGLRNPFKFHLEVDDETGATEAWIGDVGKDDREDFTVLGKGGNGGWAYYEGDVVTPGVSHAAQPSGGTPHTEPLFAYPHADGNNSATGGVFYTGTALPSLTGRYICGDFGSGRVWSVGRDGSVEELDTLRMGGNRIVDFHTDPVTGDILVLENNSWSGGPARLLRITLQEEEGEDYPQRLADLGLFADVADLSPNPGVVPYQPNLKFWSDDADKSRWFMIANTTDTIGYSRDGNWTFPEGMVWIKHFEFDLDRTVPGSPAKRLETRVLVRNEDGAYGVSYRWNESGTEATLVPNEGADFPVSYVDGEGNDAQLTWRIPSRAECMTCHTADAGHALSMNTRQFNREDLYGGESHNLLTLLADSGYLSDFSDDPEDLPRHHRPEETDVDLESRVRSYLEVNCAYCHRPGGNAPGSWDGRAHVDIDATGLLYGQPVSESVPDLSDHLVRPGDKENSAIWNRVMARDATNGTFNGYSQMPPIATNVVDPAGTELLAEWIDHHANVPPAAAEGSLSEADLSENAEAGYSIGDATATDPDVRDGVADRDRLAYRIVEGNDRRLFRIDPDTGELSLDGIVDFERRARHELVVEVSDRFAPNPGVTRRTLIIDLVDETDPDLTADTDGNGIFDAWEQAHGIADPGADADGDGVPAYFEFLSGRDPGRGRGGLMTLGDRDASVRELRWDIRNGFDLGEHYRVQASDELGTWSDLEPGAGLEVLSVTPVAPGVSRMVVEVAAPAPGRFYRLARPDAP